jgi:bifunctional DNA-binding transcriptional regulator/antitoxin component of YhaV-PrlF toxin-antitoxin module
MDPLSYHLRITDGRSVTLPAELCDGLGVHIGDTLVVRMEENQATLCSVDRVIRSFQDLVVRQIPEGVGLVDQLIAEREAAARHE